MSASLVSICPAKINLYLHATGKRDDGYHLLDSLVMFADIGDEITIKPAKELRLKIEGDFAAGLPTDMHNLVLQAASRLKQLYKVQDGADITLLKNLPLSSGIGGGSSDAATTLILLNKLWQLGLSNEELIAVALPLGADIPMCIVRESTIIGGIGEEITPVAMPELYAVLVNPNVPVSSQSIYQMGFDNFRQPLKIQDASTLYKQLPALHNDLQPSAIKLAPEISQLIDILEECDDVYFARMSGSGATCFAIFTSLDTAQSAAVALQTHHPQWWIRAVTLQG